MIGLKNQVGTELKFFFYQKISRFLPIGCRGTLDRNFIEKRNLKFSFVKLFQTEANVTLGDGF